MKSVRDLPSWMSLSLTFFSMAVTRHAYVMIATTPGTGCTASCEACPHPLPAAQSAVLLLTAPRELWTAPLAGP